MNLKKGVDKAHYAFSTRDVYHDYRRHYKKRRYRVDRKTFNRIVDSIIERIIDEVIYDNQIYKPKGKIGNFQIYKFKPTLRLPDVSYDHLRKTGGYWFYLKWDRPRKNRFVNGRIYSLRTPKSFREKLRNHVIELSDDPYKRDYTAPLLRTPSKKT